MHWPERVRNNMFGKRGLTAIDTKWEDNVFEILTIFDQFIKDGKIKHIGLSNENPYGVMRFFLQSKNHNLPQIVSIQNPYSLLNRLFEVGLSKLSMRENVDLLAYSPLGFRSAFGKTPRRNYPTPSFRIIFQVY